MSSADGTPNVSLTGHLKQFNRTLVFVMVYMCFCSFNFGYDVGNFGSVQGMQSFGRQMGVCDAETGICALQPWLSSLMTAIPFLGKALGVIICGTIAERWGRKAAVVGLIVASFVGVLLQTTATTAAQFTVGRFISFAMTGMTIVVVPIYQSEISPKALRGMITSTLQLMISLGSLVASLITYGTQHLESNAAWQIPVGLQFVAPIIITALFPFVPESPRWLLSKDRVDEARASLLRLRKNQPESAVDLEIEALRHAHSTEEKGTWAEVFDTQNRIRTMVAVIAMFGQQVTGQAFASQYAVIFYQSQGFGERSFLFSVLSSVAGLVCLVLTWFVVDLVGRRKLLFVGGSGMAIFILIVGAVGVIPNPTEAQKNTLVASFILFPCAYSLSWAPVSYVVVSEAASSRIKEKTNLFASVISVLTTFVSSFTLPYLLKEPYAALGAKVGFIYGSICVVMVVVAYFGIPELKGRSLEEIDQMFASGEKLRNFGKLKTKPVEETYVRETKGASVTETEKLEA